MNTCSSSPLARFTQECLEPDRVARVRRLNTLSVSFESMRQGQYDQVPINHGTCHTVLFRCVHASYILYLISFILYLISFIGSYVRLSVRGSGTCLFNEPITGENGRKWPEKQSMLQTRQKVSWNVPKCPIRRIVDLFDVRQLLVFKFIL